MSCCGEFRDSLVCLAWLLPALPLAALAAGPAKPTGPEGLALEATPVEVLAGRLTVQVPKGMRLEARQASIMAAPEAGEDESRLVLDHQGVRLVVMVYELYARVEGDLLGAVRADVSAGWGAQAKDCKLEALAVGKPLAAVANTPPRPTGAGPANLVLGVYVRHGDGLAQYLAFYVSPEGVPAAEGWIALARRMAATLGQGRRALSLTAGERRLRGLDGGFLVIRTPAGTSQSTQQGPDFLVHHLRLVAPLGTVGASCGLYQGGHPSYQHRQTGLPEGQVEQHKGTLLGQEVSWQRWQREGRHMLEGIVPMPGSNGLNVHAFCGAPTAAELEPLRAMLEGLRFEGGK
ncbi:MAG TPA: hypothetical protein PK668_03145 [Myxococcota bacterium]|nr:hypothetical protein [Myxococcota bacterium]HRY91850.1 hypothetical protein [Myxococcota bacterium]HSA20563.1 hypothetical protein [Myxococcota bacterium]